MTNYDYSKLYGKIKEKGFTQKTLVKKMDMAESSLNLSLNNKREFRQNEMEDILSLLGEPLENVSAFFYIPKLL